MSENSLSKAQSLIRDSTGIVVITGAGISKESGIPTFRGKEGYWKKYAPEELATPHAFRRQPELVHEWYSHRRQICATARPNAAHRALVALEQQCLDTGGEFLLITQNVDGLHRRAGSRNLLEIHGNIFQAYCTSCAYRIDQNANPANFIALECPKCGGKVRPDIVWFGEGYDAKLLSRAYEALQKSSLVISIGTSGVVYISVQLSEFAIASGARLIDINPEHSALSSLAEIFLQGPAGKILPLLV